MIFAFACFALGTGSGVIVAALWRARKDQKRERYFSFLAHELNTQVTGLQLTVENLLSGVFGPLSEEHRKWISAIEHRVDLLGCMIGDLRDVSHWEFGGQVRLMAEPTSLIETVERELARLAYTASRSKIGLDAQLPKDLPEVFVDPYRLKRVISSILHNVLKFSETGTQVVLQARPYSGQVVFQTTYKPAEHVEDLQRMLGMHYGVEGKNSALVSVGAGLGVAAKILREMGGDMEVSPGERGLVTLTCVMPQAKEPAKP